MIIIDEEQELKLLYPSLNLIILEVNRLEETKYSFNAIVTASVSYYSLEINYQIKTFNLFAKEQIIFKGRTYQVITMILEKNQLNPSVETGLEVLEVVIGIYPIDYIITECDVLDAINNFSWEIFRRNYIYYDSS